MEKSCKKGLLEVILAHGVDATQIRETMDCELVRLCEERGLDEVTFCHPHIGSESLARNSGLCAHFLQSAFSVSLNPQLVVQLTLLQG